MHEPAQASGLTALVITKQSLSNLIFPILHGTALVDADRLPTAGAPFRYGLPHDKTATVQIFLHMGDDHVPLADQYPAAGHQLHPLDKGKVVQACPGYLTSVYLYRFKNRHWGDLPGTGRVPLNREQLCFVELVLEFKGHPILIVVSCPAARPGKGNVIVGGHDPVNGDVIVLCKLPQIPDAVRHLLAGQLPLADDKFTDLEAQFREFPQFLGF